jgi:hypothetical protein
MRAWQALAKPVKGGKKRNKVLAEIDRNRTPFAWFNLRASTKSVGPLRRRLQSQ